MITIRSSISVVLLSLAVSVTARGEHPPITLLDQDGKNVLETAQPVSTMRTCNHCHDTQYIAKHSYHVSLGSDERRSRQGSGRQSVGLVPRGVWSLESADISLSFAAG